MNEGQHTGAALPWLDNLNGEEDPIRFLFHREVEGKTYGLIAEANLHTIKGHKKAGKSAAGLALIVAAIRGEFLGIAPTRPDLKVLWIDTEQDRQTLKAKARAVLRMAGVTDRPAALRILVLKPETKPDRLTYTLQAINEVTPDLVLLDGVVDLCEEFNDEKPSRAVIDNLMKISETTGAAIVNMIHTNPDKNEKARGHLGTIIEQKSAEVYNVQKYPGTHKAKIKTDCSRFEEAPDLEFIFTDNFEITGAEDRKDADRLERALKLERIFQDIFDAEQDESGQCRYTNLWKGYAEQESCGERMAKKAINEALDLSVLLKTGKGQLTRYSLLERVWDAESESYTLKARKGAAG